ncbi:MAG: hypothetical protein HY553_13995 [Elusimicrobia bacterium]|nr:hypothetical protein [Elusimicrobiota bacterium]
MEPKRMRPATRGDVGALGQRLVGRMDRLGARMQANIDGVEKRLDAKIDVVDKRLDSKIDRVAADLVRFRHEMGEFRRSVETRLSRTLTSAEFHATMDKYFAEQEAINRSREVRADLWRDHERRISALERRQSQDPPARAAS